MKKRLDRKKMITVRLAKPVSTRLFSTTFRPRVGEFRFPPSQGQTRSDSPSSSSSSRSSMGATRNQKTLNNVTAENVKVLNPSLIKDFAYGTTYDPFDFSMARLYLDRKNKSKFKVLGHNINPLDLYTSPEVLSQFMSSTGKILHRDVTGLSAKNQRRLSKAIRRAQAIGLLSKTHN